MKSLLTVTLTITITAACFAQGGWTKITSTLNPIVTFTVKGVYNGAAWVDINNDGKTDLFASPGNIFINNGSGSFTTLTGSTINPMPQQMAGGCSWGDLNNDGNIDFITSHDPTEIYINNNGSFQNISAQVPELANYASWGCALADVNNDGKLDLLFAHANGFHPQSTAQPCKYFIQGQSPLSFTLKSGYYFTDSLKPYTVPYFHDYDLDGDMDLFIASGPGGSPGPDYCYRNMKKETGMDTLYKMTVEPWASQLQDGQCYNFIDCDNDADLDLCITNYSGASDRFYLNNGNGAYTATQTPFTNMVPHLANCWGDYDNDGDLDVIIASDFSFARYCRNDGNGNFTQLNNSMSAGVKNSCIINCDFDNDGDLDVFIHGNNAGKSLWLNDTVAGNRSWVSYLLKGTISNASAIGAIVKLKAVVKGVPTWQMRHVTAQNSFQGQNDLRVHFGLNEALTIDSLLIYWPSGLKEVYVNQPAGRFETLVEGGGLALGLPANSSPLPVKVFPNPAKGSLSIITSDAVSIDTDLKIVDLQGKLLYQSQLNKSRTEISLSGIDPGAYLLIIHSGTAFTCKKIVIEK